MLRLVLPKGSLERATLEGTRGDLADKAAKTKDRIAAGLHLLQDNPDVLRAFKLANQAMHVAALKTDSANSFHVRACPVPQFSRPLC